MQSDSDTNQDKSNEGWILWILCDFEQNMELQRWAKWGHWVYFYPI